MSITKRQQPGLRGYAVLLALCVHRKMTGRTATSRDVAETLRDQIINVSVSPSHVNYLLTWLRERAGLATRAPDRGATWEPTEEGMRVALAALESGALRLRKRAAEAMRGETTGATKGE